MLTSVLLKAVRPIVKSKLKQFLFEYQDFISSRDDVSKIKMYLKDIFDEIITEYIEEKKL